MSHHNKARRGVATQNENGVRVTLEEAESYSPYPPPELVRAFEEIQSGLADRLMTLVEKEQAMSHQVTQHQMVEAAKVNDANIRNQKHNSQLFFLGLVLGVLMGLSILGVTVYALYQGYPYVAAWAFTTLAAILTILVLRRMPSPSNHKESSIEKPTTQNK